VRENETFFTNQALTCRHSQNHNERIIRFYYWQFFRYGLFHHVSSILDLRDSQEVSYLLLVDRIGAAIKLFGDLFSEMGCEDEILIFTVGVNHAEGCRLVDSDADKSEKLICYIPEVKVRKRRTVADLVSAPVEHAVRVIREVCERFNLPSDRHPELRRRLRRRL